MKRLLLVGALAASFQLTAHAAESESPFYAGVETVVISASDLEPYLLTGTTKTTVFARPFNNGSQSESTSGGGLTLFGGYNYPLSEKLTLKGELKYSLGDATLYNLTRRTDNGSYDVTVKQKSLIQLQAKLAYKTDVWGLTPYIGLGLNSATLTRNITTLGGLKADADSKSSALNFILGTEKKITDKWSARLDWTSISYDAAESEIPNTSIKFGGEKSTVTVVGIGALYKL